MMERRTFLLTAGGALVSTFALSRPFLASERPCSFCSVRYPEATWLVEAEDGTLLCNHCARALESALHHLGCDEQDIALDLLRDTFPAQVRVSG